MKMWQSALLFYAVMVIPPIACGSGDGADPVAACYELSRTACVKLNECTGVVVTECEQAIADEIDCEATTKVHENFKYCLKEWKAATCAAVNDDAYQGPASCMDVFD